jgi:hypothetical protein
MKQVITILFLTISISFFSCDDDGERLKKKQSGIEDVATNPEKDAEIQYANLEHRKRMAGERFPCDTLALMDFVLKNYPEGTYLVDFDKTLTYNIPRSAVIYYNKKYVIGVIAKSREGERLVEVKNIIGYDQSFIDLDSTDLGTAFFFLTLYECKDESFKIVWESPIPSHGGFNNMSLHKWKFNNSEYVKVNFHYAQGIGHIDYNYFFVDGLTNKPHLLMTYEGINFKRTVTSLNEDKYPDYYEYLYYDSGSQVFPKDSIGFIWNSSEKVYVNTRNNKQTRLY